MECVSHSEPSYLQVLLGATGERLTTPSMCPLMRSAKQRCLCCLQVLLGTIVEEAMKQIEQPLVTLRTGLEGVVAVPAMRTVLGKLDAAGQTLRGELCRACSADMAASPMQVMHSSRCAVPLGTEQCLLLPC